MYLKKEFKNLIFDLLGTLIGAFIMAIGTALFLLPNKLSSGGFSGIATIFYYLLKIPMGTTILLFNIPLFIFAAYKLGKSFFIKAIVGTISFSIFINMIDKFQALTTDRFLACIYGGIIIGLGTAIILKSNSSTGGSDLISNILKSYTPDIRMSNVITILDIIIVSLNMIVFKEIEIGLYSAIAIYLMGKVIDIIFEGIYFTKLLIIISDKNQEISDEIGDKIGKGTTRVIWEGNVYKSTKISINLCCI